MNLFKKLYRILTLPFIIVNRDRYEELLQDNADLQGQVRVLTTQRDVVLEQSRSVEREESKVCSQRNQAWKLLEEAHVEIRKNRYHLQKMVTELNEQCKTYATLEGIFYETKTSMKAGNKE